MKYTIFFTLIICFHLNGQVHFDKQYESREIKHVAIENFKGNIQVTTSETEEVKIKAILDGEILASTRKLIENRKGDVLYLYLEHPCENDLREFDKDNPFSSDRYNTNCEWEGSEHDFPDLDFIVEVPKNMNIYVATVMDGSIKIDGVSGNIHALNVNGSVEMHDVAKVERGTTVNGNIDIYYKEKPSVAGQFSTINGEINLHVPTGSSLHTKFKSYMGELFTDLNAKELDAKPKASEVMEPGTSIKFDEFSEALIGTGDISMTIETFNGNAFIRKNK